MRYLSTFSGLGGFELAVHNRLKDAKCVGYSEIDKFAVQTYEKNFPSHKGKNFGDIERLVFDLDSKGNFVVNEARVKMLPDFDLLVGGSPCQDLSIAKAKRKGLDGLKSRLFFAYLEILRIKKPKYFILENVASMSKEAKEAITDAISKAYGRRIEPMTINSGLVSAQNRERVYWFPWEVEQPEDKGIVVKDLVSWSRSTRYKDENGKVWSSPGPGRTSYVEQRINTNGKANTLTTGQGCGSFSSKNYMLETTFKKEIKNDSTKPIRVGHIRKGGQGQRVYSIEGKSICLGATSGGQGRTSGLYHIEDTVRMLSTVECERLQGLPDDWTAGVSDAQRYKQLGNAVNVPTIEHILSGLENQLIMEI